MAWLNVVLHTLYFLLLVPNLLYQTRVISIRVGRVVSPIPDQTSHWSWKKGTEEKITHKTDGNNCCSCNCNCSDLWINMETKRIGIDQTNTLTDGRAWFTSGVCTTGSQKNNAMVCAWNATQCTKCIILHNWCTLCKTQVTNKMHEIIAHIYNEIKCLNGINKCNALHSHWQQIGIR